MISESDGSKQVSTLYRTAHDARETNYQCSVYGCQNENDVNHFYNAIKEGNITDCYQNSGNSSETYLVSQIRPIKKELGNLIAFVIFSFLGLICIIIITLCVPICFCYDLHKNRWRSARCSIQVPLRLWYFFYYSIFDCFENIARGYTRYKKKPKEDRTIACLKSGNLKKVKQLFSEENGNKRRIIVYFLRETRNPNLSSKHCRSVRSCKCYKLPCIRRGQGVK